MVGRGRTTTTALGASVGVAGVVLAVFQVLESSIGDFHPRREVQTLIAVTIFVAGLALSRLRILAARRQARDDRDAQLDEDLAVWPLETVDRADPYYLGVFPLPAERGQGGGLDGYVARDVDDEVIAAMRTEPFVLVYGPGRAGKSRTAYEAARRALPDAWVIVPEGPDELRTLMHVDPPLNLGPYIGVIWLDDLDRFAPSLDIDLMDAVGGRRQRLQIVATIREDAYEAMLEAGGQEGETARRILTRARGIHLPAKLSAREEKEAASLLKGRRRGTPLGADTDELLRGGHAPADRPRGESSVTLVTSATPTVTSERWQRRLPAAVRDDIEDRRARHAAERDARRAEQRRRDDLKARGIDEGTDVFPRRFSFDVPFAGVLALLAVSFAALGLVISMGFTEKPKTPPSLDEQLEDAFTVMDAHKWRASRRTVFARGENQPSYLFVYTPKSLDESSEIRIYDQVGQNLPLRFQFQPEPALGGDGDKLGWRFFVRSRKIDINGSGGADVVGAFHPADDRPGADLPVVIYNVGRRYVIKGLGRATSKLRGERVSGKRVVLHQVGRLQKLQKKHPLNVGPTYAVADFAVANLNDAPKLIVGQFVSKPRPLESNVVAVRAWRLGTDPTKPYLGVPCRVVVGAAAADAALTFSSPADVLWRSVLAKWKLYDSKAICRSGAS